MDKGIYLVPVISSFLAVKRRAALPWQCQAGLAEGEEPEISLTGKEAAQRLHHRGRGYKMSKVKTPGGKITPQNISVG